MTLTRCVCVAIKKSTFHKEGGAAGDQIKEIRGGEKMERKTESRKFDMGEMFTLM